MKTLVSSQVLEKKIYLIRGERVMLDADAGACRLEIPNWNFKF